MTKFNESEKEVQSTSIIDSWYAKYVLFVLLLFNILNYLDRSILTILAEDIKLDLGITDAQLGFLSGTAFAVFYATFGMALGRLADIWNRRKLISIGVFFWSGMTALSGLTKSFLPLTACRFGVAVGESSASPAAYSLIYDYFSPKLRTTALAIYASAISVGGGLGLYLGGIILENWKQTWPDPTSAPFGLAGWQAAFIIVGLPGILMALWVATIKEPKRGLADGIETKAHPHPFKEMFLVMFSMLPVVNWKSLTTDSTGARNIKPLITNMVVLIVICLSVYGLIVISDNPAQWISLGIGLYAAFSWGQGLAKRDPVVFGMIFKCKTMVGIIIAQSTFVILIAAIPFWVVPYFIRQFGMNAAEVGTVLGIGGPIVGIVGLLLGGRIADLVSAKTLRGKLYVWLAGYAAAIVSAALFVMVSNSTQAYICFFSISFFCSIAGAPYIATFNDLVLPRGRATTSSFFYMVLSLANIVFGPFFIGFISDMRAASGISEGESLQQAMIWGLVVATIGIIPAVYSILHVEEDSETRLLRARALGEQV